ncbi:MAG: putative 7-carboxy-7-deazaguanine synthase QueE [Eubacterium sp.]|nr:putative 7-carboxy-7-deazaguanine synthase QueE [Eubacterium sp.]
MSFKVAEKFISINGESRFAGELAVFIRFAGCNLSCSYCDTAWAIPMDCPHEEMSIKELTDYVVASGVDRVTLTGGEPLLQEDIESLVAELIGRNKKVEIETNGAVSIAPLMEMAARLSITDEMSVTLDYKCPSSGMEEFNIEENYALLREYDTVKFVVGSREDMEKAEKIISGYRLIDRHIAVYLSPVFGRIESSEIVEYMKNSNMNGVRHQLQQHKFIWDPDKRGV